MGVLFFGVYNNKVSRLWGWVGCGGLGVVWLVKTRARGKERTKRKERIYIIRCKD